MPRDYKQQLDDILQAITFIREYVKDIDYNAFEADKNPFLLTIILALIWIFAVIMSTILRRGSI